MRVSLDSGQSVYPRFVLVCTTPASSTRVMLRGSCLTLEIKEFRCFEVEILKIKEGRLPAFSLSSIVTLKHSINSFITDVYH